jgi:fatty acid desaturase
MPKRDGVRGASMPAIRREETVPMPHGAPPGPFGGRWQRFLRSRHGPFLTHASLAALTSALFVLLWYAPLWLAVVPGVLLLHRIGVLLHEYLHGIPFRRYRYNLAVYGFFDGLMLGFGLFELFRGTHLAHHRWLNSGGDSAYRTAHRSRSGILGWLAALEAVEQFRYLWEAFRGRQRYVRLHRLALGAILSLSFVVIWWRLGRPDMPIKLGVLTMLTMLVPVSLRGAVEHHGHPDDPGFANEYRVWIPLFNLNRHVHHHEDMRCPWYLLTWRTPRPLPASAYFTHWFRVYVRKDYTLMRPMQAGAVRVADIPDAGSGRGTRCDTTADRLPNA